MQIVVDMARQRPFDQGFRFILVGIVNTLFGYGVFALLIFVLGKENYLQVVIGSHVVSTTLAFILNRKFVFDRRGPILPDLWRFHVVYSFALGLNLACLVFLVGILGLGVLMSQGTALVAIAFLSYFGHKHFSFAERTR